MDDPIQLLKSQIGELIWNNAILVTQNNKLTKEIETLKKDLENARTISSSE